MTTPESTTANASRPYEFDAGQNEVIRELANAMRWVAIPLMVAGLMYVMQTIMLLVATWGNWRLALFALIMAAGAFIFLSLASWTNRSAMAFAEVVATQGNDIPYLMTALDSLRKTYSLLSLFVKLYIALMAITLVAIIIGYFTGSLPQHAV